MVRDRLIAATESLGVDRAGRVLDPELVLPAARLHLDREGYCVLVDVLTSQDLRLLRGECDALTAESAREMESEGRDVLDLNHRGRRYFVSKRSRDRPRLRQFLFGGTMAALCRALLADDVWLFNEQFVVKPPRVGMEFSWHQDSGYIPRECPHEPYLSLWCALDDVDADNGGLFVLPASQSPAPGRIEHERDARSNDLVGYRGDEPGEGITVAAGSVVAFSSVTLHRSSPNPTDVPRRVFLAQYSAQPIFAPDSRNPWALAVPFLSGGKRVAQPAEYD